MARADLVVTEAKAGIWSSEYARYIAVVGEAGGLPSSLLRRFTLQSDFTVGQLLDVLDLAAIWLLDQRSRVATKSITPQDDDGLLYKLLQWPPVSTQFNGPCELRALALLVSRPVSLAALCAHSGLELSRARDLITELWLLNLLDVTDELGHQVDVLSGSRSLRHRLMGKMLRWVSSGSRRATP